MWPLGALLCAGAFHGAAAEGAPDAVALAQGGVWIFEQLDLAPGAPVEHGGVALAVWRADPEAGIQTAAVRIVQVRARQAGAVVLEQLQSPVLRETRYGAAWQCRVPRVPARAGAALQAARREFDRYGAWWRFEARAGASWCTRHAAAGVVLHVPAEAGAVPQLHAGVQWRTAGHAVFALQADPDPVRPGAWHAAWSWDASGYRALAGYDAAAQAVGVGLDVAHGSVHVVWGARLHPELGWSHAWSLAWQH